MFYAILIGDVGENIITLDGQVPARGETMSDFSMLNLLCAAGDTHSGLRAPDGNWLFYYSLPIGKWD